MKEFTITENMWNLSKDEKYQYNCTHNLNTKSLNFSVTDLEGNPMASAISIEDENNLVIYSDTNDVIKLVIEVREERLY